MATRPPRRSCVPYSWRRRKASSLGKSARRKRRRTQALARPSRCHGELLHDDMWRRVFRFLTLEEIGCVVPLVSRRFRALASEPLLKKAMLERLGLRLVEEAPADLWEIIAMHFAGTTIVETLLTYPLSRMMLNSADVEQCLSTLPCDYHRIYTEVRLTTPACHAYTHKLEGGSKRFFIDGFPLSVHLSVSGGSGTLDPWVLQIAFPVYTTCGCDGTSWKEDEKFVRQRLERKTRREHAIRRMLLDVKPFLVLREGFEELECAPLEVDCCAHDTSALLTWSASRKQWRRLSSSDELWFAHENAVVRMAIGIRVLSDRWYPVTPLDELSLLGSIVAR